MNAPRADSARPMRAFEVARRRGQTLTIVSNPP